MTAYSLRRRLLALWVLLLASAAATAYLMFGVYNQSTGVQVAQADLAVGARLPRDHRPLRRPGPRPRPRNHRGATASAPWSAALARFPRIEGGIWSASGKSVAYAYPTYEGTGPKTDLPAASTTPSRH